MKLYTISGHIVYSAQGLFLNEIKGQGRITKKAQKVTRAHLPVFASQLISPSLDDHSPVSSHVTSLTPVSVKSSWQVMVTVMPAAIPVQGEPIALVIVNSGHVPSMGGLIERWRLK